ncbi:hypothetical protein BGX34_007919 [Mortierella sp. NVP85]|nr:hypothetical protein BGX34_007919 [Mortierella sp. NVP85]
MGEGAYNVFKDTPKEYEDEPEVTKSYSTTTKHRSSSRSSDCDFLYSPNVVLPALKCGYRRPYALYYAKTVVQNRKKRKDDPVSDCIEVARLVGVKVVQVSKHDLNDMAQQRPHQGVVLETSKLQETYIKALGPLSADNKYKVMIEGVEKEFICKPNEPPVWLALDEVVDPQNLGAIMRTAMFMGVDGVVVCHKNSAPLSAVASKASAGALEERPTYGVTSLMKLVQESQANGWDVIGAHISFGSKRNRPLHTWPETGVDKPTLLIVGNEGKGLRDQIAKQCDAFIQIPNVNAEESVVESLNVSVATGIVLAKLMNGRFMNLPKNLKMYPHRIHSHKIKKSKDDDDDDDDEDDD